MSLIKTLKLFLKNTQAIAAVEFALCAPFLLALMMGTVEVSRYIILNQKIEKVAYTMADVVAQSDSDNFTTASIDSLVTATGEIMKPYSFNSNGIIHITSVNKPVDSTNTVNWRYTGGGTLTGNSSKLGSVGGTATLPNDLTLNDRDNVIISEVYYVFTPMFGSAILGSRTLYKLAIYKPRLGELVVAPS